MVGNGASPLLPSDEQLVGRVMAGSRDAFDELIRRYQKQALAVSYRLLGNSHDAAEVTQDAFLSAYSSLPTLQQRAAFKGWLLRIVSNLSLNKRRGRRKNVGLPADDLLGNAGAAGGAGGAGAWMAKEHDPHHGMESQELGERLRAAMDKLPEKQRMALVMFTLQEMSQKDVAEALECSVEAVKWHVFQARKRLKEMLKDDLIEQ
jgi:RNA polymerase sigma-70 factor (ECF subfamily)